MVNINKLNGGDIVITKTGGSTENSKTRFILANGSSLKYDISGTLDRQWFIDHGLYDNEYSLWTEQITEITIGSNVSYIGSYALLLCPDLKTVIIPNNVISIGSAAFYGCDMLTNMVFQGRTLEQVQSMENYGEGWGISDTSIISVA